MGKVINRVRARSVRISRAEAAALEKRLASAPRLELVGDYLELVHPAPEQYPIAWEEPEPPEPVSRAFRGMLVGIPLGLMLWFAGVWLALRFLP